MTQRIGSCLLRVVTITATLLTSMIVVGAGGVESADTISPAIVKHELQLPPDRPMTGSRPGSEAHFSFNVFVFENTDWTLDEVAETIRQAANIFATECGFSIELKKFLSGRVPPAFLQLDTAKQALILGLLNIPRPVVFFINQTANHDYGYSYLAATPSPSQETVWITRRVAPSCRGRLLAHEIGHIALNVATHSPIRDNLMGYTCHHSNVRNFATNVGLTQAQCKVLEERYAR